MKSLYIYVVLKFTKNNNNNNSNRECIILKFDFYLVIGQIFRD